MSAKPNLSQMLREIAEDEKVERHRRQQLSQAEIRKLFADKRKQEKAPRGQDQ